MNSERVVCVLAGATAALIVGSVGAAERAWTRSAEAGVAPPQATVQDVAWLEGSWVGEGLGGMVDEVWSAPAAGTIAGVFRMIGDDGLRFSEIVQISEEGGSLLLRLKHFDRELHGWEEKDETVDFPLVAIDDHTAWFDGLTIRRLGDDRLEVWVELGDGDGDTREAPFRYRRRAPGPAPVDDELRRLADRLAGSFSSAAQAGSDERFHPIVLRASRIWPEREDAVWLYVEQGTAATPDEPYRQRVYRLTTAGDDLFESRVFELPEAAAVVGGWREPRLLDGLEPGDLADRPGCSILLRKHGDRFVGSTLGSLCASDHRGARWATSEVVVGDGWMESWDRGWSDHGEQAWGSEAGPYRFDRVE